MGEAIAIALITLTAVAIVLKIRSVLFNKATRCSKRSDSTSRSTSSRFNDLQDK